MKIKDVKRLVNAELSKQYAQAIDIPMHMMKRPKTIVFNSLMPEPKPLKIDTALPQQPQMLPQPMMQQPMMLPQAAPAPQPTMPMPMPGQAAGGAEDIMSLLNLG